MNKYKIYENPEEFIEMSEDDMERILLKNIVDSENCEYAQFIFSNFKPIWFKSEIVQKIFKICNVFWSKYEKLPNEETIIKIFKNKKWEDSLPDLKKEYNNIISFDISKFNHAFIKDAIIKFIKDKALYFTILDVVDDINKDGIVENIIGQFENILKIDLNDDLGIEYFKNLDKHCEDISKTTDKTSFGYKELDHYTYGGLPTHDTCLFLIMAQPGLGKSQLMMNIAYHWVLNNKKVLVVSLEMSEDMYSRRFDALFADLSPNTLKDNIPILKSRVKGVKLNVPKSELRIKEFPTGTLTTAHLKQYLKNLKSSENFEPDIIFVDYLNIMRPNSYGASTSLYEKCAKISEELRALSGEKKIPIVSAIQSNRSNAGTGYAGENIDINNVSESSGITATTDALFALYQLDGERDLGRINIKILKNRLGGYVGYKFPMLSNYETLKIEDWPENLSTNDDVLGEVEDETAKKFKNNVNYTKTNNNSELDEL